MLADHSSNISHENKILFYVKYNKLMVKTENETSL